VELTDAGRALVAEAQRTLAAASAAREAVSAVQGAVIGQLRFGAIPTPGVLDQARLLRGFHAAHSGITIQYVRDTSMVLLHEVLHGRLDVALISQPLRQPPGIIALPLVSEPVVLACPIGHRLAGATALTSADLAAETLIGAPAGSVGHDVIQAFAPSGPTGPQVPYVVNDVVTILEFVAAGLGVALVQASPVRARNDLVAVPLAQPPEWTLAIITSEARGISKAAQVLITAIQTELAPSSARTLEADHGRDAPTGATPQANSEVKLY
jgi:DNA-binding transcriptional LysR family regulator